MEKDRWPSDAPAPWGELPAWGEIPSLPGVSPSFSTGCTMYGNSSAGGLFLPLEALGGGMWPTPTTPCAMSQLQSPAAALGLMLQAQMMTSETPIAMQQGANQFFPQVSPVGTPTLQHMSFPQYTFAMSSPSSSPMMQNFNGMQQQFFACSPSSVVGTMTHPQAQQAQQHVQVFLPPAGIPGESMMPLATAPTAQPGGNLYPEAYFERWNQEGEKA